ncbi:hypothetical protein FEK41_17015 [Escherichia sp. E4694]|uniref:P22AR C-terminal domain-containing protein n=1 Tax=Escherichia sp. E4694 TaxID=2044464 RepID=UPI0010FEF846|nr:P22AR C-terminal domain-containing protein [Escherichia sp. E4694]TLI93838.1 hypothetical protein FEK41_17015 [Escherichia sp. E4694]
MSTQLVFHQTKFHPVKHNNSIWLTAVEIAQALGYKKSDAVTQIYDRNSDEFRADMTETLNLSVSGNYQKTIRIFSLRGAHLIAMFARTPVAKEFRRWVLDILDREVQQSPITKQFTDNELCTLAWLWRAGDVMLTACQNVTPLLQVAEHREAGRFTSIEQEYPQILHKAREILARETAHVRFQSWQDDKWSRVLPHLRSEQ